MLIIIGVASTFSGGALFLEKVDDPFLVAALKTQAKNIKSDRAELTALTLQVFSAHQTGAVKFDFLLSLGMHLTAWGFRCNFPL